MSTRLTRNEMKLLLLAARNKNAIFVVVNMVSVIINIRIGARRFSPEFFKALENLRKKKYVDFRDVKDFSQSVTVEYQLSPRGIEKVKLLKADRSIRNRK